MPALPSYKTLDIYNLSKQLVQSCYELSAQLPAEERSNLALYLRSSAVTAHLNVAQGIFLKKKKKVRQYINKALNALVVVDAALEVLQEVGFATEEQTAVITGLSSSLYLSLDGLKKGN